METNKHNVTTFLRFDVQSTTPGRSHRKNVGAQYIQQNSHVAGIDVFRLDDHGKVVEHWDA